MVKNLTYFIMQFTDEEPKGQTQGSNTGSLAPECSVHCTAPPPTGIMECLSEPFISTGCNYLQSIFLSFILEVVYQGHN